MTRWMVVIMVAGAVPARSGPVDELDLRTLALSGQQAPGAAPGVTLAAFGALVDLLASTDDSARQAFHATVAGPGVEPSNRVGIWMHDGAQLRAVARAGDPAPGTAPGVTFLNFQTFEVSLAPAIGGGRTMVLATPTGPGVTFDNDFGVWSDTNGVLSLVVRDGDPSPGGTPDQRLLDMFPISISDTGAVLLQSNQVGPGVSALADEGLLSDRSGAIDWLMLEGDQVPGAQPGVLFGRNDLGSPGVFLFSRLSEGRGLVTLARIRGAGVTSNNDEVLVAELDGVLELVAREDSPVPGFPNRVFGGPGSSASFGIPAANDVGHLAFRVGVSGEINDTAIFSDRGGELALEVVTRDPAPGTPSTFTTLGDGVLDDLGRLAFRAALAEGGSGIWWDPGGGFEPFVLTGDALTSPAGATLISSANALGLTADGVVAFQGTADLPGIGPASGLFMADAEGDIRAIALLSQPFDVPGADTRVVSRIASISLGEGGLGFQLDFTDGSSGRFLARLPAANAVFADGFESGDVAAWSP